MKERIWKISVCMESLTLKILKHSFRGKLLSVSMCVCVYICLQSRVWKRERERESEGKTMWLKEKRFFCTSLQFFLLSIFNIFKQRLYVVHSQYVCVCNSVHVLFHYINKLTLEVWFQGNWAVQSSIILWFVAYSPYGNESRKPYNKMSNVIIGQLLPPMGL